MKHTTVLFFIAGRVPTDEENIELAKLKKLATHVYVRSHKLHRGEREPADFVAGLIPDVYANHAIMALDVENKPKDVPSQPIVDALDETSWTTTW